MTITYLKKSPKTSSTDDTKTTGIVQDLLKDLENTKEQGCIDLTKKFDKYDGNIIVPKDKIEKFIYHPTAEIVKYAKSLNVPIICFPRNIVNYKNYVKEVKPDCINIDYNVNPVSIIRQIDIPIQGGLDPQILLSSKHDLKKKTNKILNVFKAVSYTHLTLPTNSWG